MRYLAGISGLALLIIGIALIAQTRSITSTWQITGENIVCLVIGAILLLMAIRPEQVSGVLNFGKKG